jgi:hypothetical protein
MPTMGIARLILFFWSVVVTLCQHTMYIGFPSPSNNLATLGTGLTQQAKLRRVKAEREDEISQKVLHEFSSIQSSSDLDALVQTEVCAQN